MNDDFSTRASDAASAADHGEHPEEFEKIEISALPPSRRSHYLLLALSQARQRLLAALHSVSRATWRDIVQVARDKQTSEHDPDFELEISELPPTQRSHVLLRKLTRAAGTRAPEAAAAALPARPRGRLAGRALSALAMCLVLTLLLMSIPEVRGSVLNALMPTPTPTSVAYVSTYLSGVDANAPVIVHPFGTPPSSYQNSPGAMPTTCPHISSLQYFTSPLDPPGLGDGPVWLSGFSGPSAALDNLSPFFKPDQGWYETLAIFIQRGFTGDIVLHGTSQRTGLPILLSKSDPAILNNSISYNLNDGSSYLSPSVLWKMTTIVIAVPAAGCYSLAASWNNHSWIRYFAAGA